MDKKFSPEEINKLSHKFENCLENCSAREIFKSFLQKLRKKELQRVVMLWEKADEDLKYSSDFDDDEYFDVIERIDDFNDGPLMSISENNHKYIFVKRECCRILDKIRPEFVRYLCQYHKS